MSLIGHFVEVGSIHNIHQVNMAVISNVYAEPKRIFERMCASNANNGSRQIQEKNKYSVIEPYVDIGIMENYKWYCVLDQIRYHINCEDGNFTGICLFGQRHGRLIFTSADFIGVFFGVFLFVLSLLLLSKVYDVCGIELMSNVHWLPRLLTFANILPKISIDTMTSRILNGVVDGDDEAIDENMTYGYNWIFETADNKFTWCKSLFKAHQGQLYFIRKQLKHILRKDCVDIRVNFDEGDKVRLDDGQSGFGSLKVN